jgi:hypothetical protein
VILIQLIVEPDLPAHQRIGGGQTKPLLVPMCKPSVQCGKHSRQHQNCQPQSAQKVQVGCYHLTDVAVMTGAVVSGFVHDEGGRNGQRKHETDTEQQSGYAFLIRHDPFPPSLRMLILSRLTAMIAYPVKNRFSGIPGKSVMLQQMLSHVIQLFAFKMNQLPALFAFTVKMRRTRGGRIYECVARTLAGANKVFLDLAFSHKTFQLTVDSSGSYRSSCIGKMIPQL